MKQLCRAFLCSLLVIFLFTSFACGAESGRPFNDVPKTHWYYNDVYNA